MTKKFIVTDSRYKFMVIALLIIFLSIMTLFYLKADEVTKDPCSICAERYEEPVVCILPGTTPIERIFFPNETVITDISD